jgi:hypothetical protein
MAKASTEVEVTKNFKKEKLSRQTPRWNEEKQT